VARNAASVVLVAFCETDVLKSEYEVLYQIEPACPMMFESRLTMPTEIFIVTLLLMRLSQIPAASENPLR
jgi:hypothetical protein